MQETDKMKDFARGTTRKSLPGQEDLPTAIRFGCTFLRERTGSILKTHGSGMVEFQGQENAGRNSTRWVNQKYMGKGLFGLDD